VRNVGYTIETRAREQKLTPEQIYQLRQEKSKPILEEFKTWLTQLYPQTPPRTKDYSVRPPVIASISGINPNATSMMAA
jgi:hypothetical protein